MIWPADIYDWIVVILVAFWVWDRRQTWKASDSVCSTLETHNRILERHGEADMLLHRRILDLEMPPGWEKSEPNAKETP